MSSSGIKFEDTNTQAELLFVGICFKDPNTYIKYGKSMRSKYDFSDDACRFFYDEFENYFLTFSQDVSENKMNTYMTENMDRLKKYKNYGGWKTIKSMMELADPDDSKNVFNTIKKYSLVREYARKGFPTQKILEFEGFQKLTAKDVYRLIRSKCDKINTVINNEEEAVILTQNTRQRVKSFLSVPEFGTTSCFTGFNKYTRGYLKTKIFFNGFLSNEGKSRYMMRIICDIALKQKKKIMLLSNEQTEQDFHNCMITTIINNPDLQELTGVTINKKEEEIVMGLYRSDKTGEIMYIHTDNNGNPTETDDEFEERVFNESSEYRKIIQISDWIDNQTKNKLIYFLDVSGDYSDDSLETEIRKAKLCYGCEHIFYDTLKVFGCEDWRLMKATATKLVELCKKESLYMMCSFQLTDDSVHFDVFDLTSNNIATAKGIKTVVDIMSLGKQITKDEYNKYQYIPFDSYSDDMWGDEIIPIDLRQDKRYFAQRIDKNRLAAKGQVLLYEYNLDYNTWNNIGLLIKKC